MKVFWQYTRAPQAQHQALNSQNLAIEDVCFPGYVVQELEDCLKRSQELLPVKARKFQGWEVGLLRRFMGRDLGG